MQNCFSCNRNIMAVFFFFCSGQGKSLKNKIAKKEKKKEKKCTSTRTEVWSPDFQVPINIFKVLCTLIGFEAMKHTHEYLF